MYGLVGRGFGNFATLNAIYAVNLISEFEVFSDLASCGVGFKLSGYGIHSLSKK